jgi:hypothetical protein
MTHLPSEYHTAMNLVERAQRRGDLNAAQAWLTIAERHMRLHRQGEASLADKHKLKAHLIEKEHRVALMKQQLKAQQPPPPNRPHRYPQV